MKNKEITKEVKKACIVRKSKCIRDEIMREENVEKTGSRKPPKKGLHARIDYARSEKGFTEYKSIIKKKDADYTVTEWFEEWLRVYKLNSVKSGTYESYVCIFNYYIQPLIGDMYLNEVEIEELQKFYNCLYDAGYSKSTLSLVKVITGAMFKQAYLNGLIDINPAERVIMPKIMEEKKKKHVLTRQEQRIILREVKGHPLEGIVELALATGMRIGELTALEWRDINFNKKEITVRGTLKRSRNQVFYKDIPKTDSSIRVIPMLNSVYNILRRIQDIRKYEKKCENFKPLKGFENFVFLRENGSPYDGQHIRQQLNHLVDYINYKYHEQFLEHITPHCFRHTFATRAMECGMPPKVVQEILGHSSIKMTLDMYTHILQEDKCEQMGRLEEWMNFK